MKRIKFLFNNENGFVLVVAMVMLVVLTLLGTFALDTTTIELQISGNDRVAKQTFYQADGGQEVGIEMVEQNLSCPNGFTTTPISGIIIIGGVDVYDASFAYDEDMEDVQGAPSGVLLDDIPSDTVRAIRIVDDPANRTDTNPHTNLAIWGKTQYVSGSAVQMAAGYEGKGKGAAGGSGSILYKVHSQHIGAVNSISVLLLEWRHLIGMEGSCKY